MATNDFAFAQKDAAGKWLRRTQASVVGAVTDSVASATPLYVLTTAPAAIASTTTPTTIVGTGNGTLTIPANSTRAGSIIQLRAFGLGARVSGTMAWRVTVGGITVHTNVITPSATYETMFVATLVFLAAGASVTVRSLGQIFESGVAPLLLLDAGSTVNTTASMAIDVTIAHSVSAAGNTFTGQGLIVDFIY